MSDPRDIDEDAILKGLSPEELDQLEYELAEMDPEVAPPVLACGGASAGPPGGLSESTFTVCLLPECHAARRLTSARPDQEGPDGSVRPRRPDAAPGEGGAGAQGQGGPGPLHRREERCGEAAAALRRPGRLPAGEDTRGFWFTSSSGGNELRLLFLPAGKAFVAKKPAEIPAHEQVILEPELEEALKNATDAEMCDIAGWDAPGSHLRSF